LPRSPVVFAATTLAAHTRVLSSYTDVGAAAASLPQWVAQKQAAALLHCWEELSCCDMLGRPKWPSKAAQAAVAQDHSQTLHCNSSHRENWEVQSSCTSASLQSTSAAAASRWHTMAGCAHWVPRRLQCASQPAACHVYTTALVGAACHSSYHTATT
jgi:hypothetical protein